LPIISKVCLILQFQFEIYAARRKKKKRKERKPKMYPAQMLPT